MRRIFLFVLVVTGSFLATSCLTIEERVKLNADGSGEQINTIDFGSVLDNPLMQMGLQEEMKKQGGEMPGRIDSTFTIVDQLSANNPQWTAAERELVSRVRGEMVVDLEEGIGYVITRFPFDNAAQISQLAELVSSANKPEEGDDNPFAGMSGQSFLTSVMAVKGTKMTRSTNKAASFENPFAGEDMEEGVMDMMLEMFGDAVVSYVMEFPGDVKKVKGFPGHEIVEDNKVVMMFDFMELMKEPEMMAKALTGEVKFKK